PRELAGLSGAAIGRAVPGATLEVVDEHGSAVAPGTVGELRARGPGVMLGYWNDPEATDECLRDGWLYTGDLATVDGRGCIVHKGRRNALVKIAGFRVHPSVLEDFVMRCLAVSQAVAVAFESPRVGTRLALWVKLIGSSSTPTASEIIARCRAELPRHLVPDLVQIVDDLPLNHSLKIDRPLLTQLAEREATRRRTPA